MSATVSTTDSNLSGKPSDDIDKQTGPADGNNAESAGSSLNAGTKPVASGNNPTNPGSHAQTGSSGTNAQQPNTGSGSH
jgi:hypothetical protein